MRRIGSIHFLYGLLALAVVWWLAGRFGGEEGRIRKELGRLEELLEKGPGEGNVVAANRARQLGELFAEPFEVDLGSHGGTLSDRGALARVALRYRREYASIEAGFRDIEIELGPAERSAAVELTAHLFGLRGSAPERESYRLAFAYGLQDGEWRIEKARLLEILEGPAWL